MVYGDSLLLKKYSIATWQAPELDVGAENGGAGFETVGRSVGLFEATHPGAVLEIVHVSYYNSSRISYTSYLQSRSRLQFTVTITLISFAPQKCKFLPTPLFKKFKIAVLKHKLLMGG
jgi:hypothetical protein